MMRKIGSLIGALTLLASARVWAQDVLLYSKTITNPYCSITATLELWGDADGSVQEYVNYAMYAECAEESNVIRINADDRIKIVWTLSGAAATPTIREVFQDLSGLDEAALSDTPLTVQASIGVDGQIRRLVVGAVAQTLEWTLEGSGAGVRWADLALSFSGEELLTFDGSGVLSTGFGSPLIQKKIQVQWIRGDIAALSLSPIESAPGTLRATVSTVSGSGSDRSAWRTVNLWKDGVPLPPDCLSIHVLDEYDGIRTEQVIWVAEEGKSYQLQVVDRVGQSLSVFYPILNVKR
jgi:hypothetical protein